MVNSSADNSLHETPNATPPSGLVASATNGVDGDDDSRDVSRASSVDRDSETEQLVPATNNNNKRSKRAGTQMANKRLKATISKLNRSEADEAAAASGGGHAPSDKVSAEKKLELLHSVTLKCLSGVY